MQEEREKPPPKVLDYRGRPNDGPAQPLDYGRPPKHYPRSDERLSSTAEFIFGFVISIIVSFVTFAAMPRYSSGLAFFTIWFLVLSPIVGVGIVFRVKFLRPSWLNGVVAGVLLNFGMCGLLWSICGNPFRPLL